MVLLLSKIILRWAKGEVRSLPQIKEEIFVLLFKTLERVCPSGF
jgi:hypothetical protein